MSESLPCELCLMAPMCIIRYSSYEKRITQFSKYMFEGCNEILVYLYTDTNKQQTKERTEQFYSFFRIKTIKVVFMCLEGELNDYTV